MTQRAPSKKQVRRLKRPVWLFVLAGFVAILIASAAFLQSAYAEKLPPGVHLGTLNLSGLKVNEAINLVRTTLATAEATGTKLKFQDKNLALDYSVVDSAGIGLSSDAVTYNIDSTVDKVTSYNATGSPLVATLKKLRAVLFGATITPDVEIDHDVLVRGLKNTLGAYEDPAVEPAYALSGSSVVVTDPSAGTAFDYDTIATQVESYVRKLSTDPIVVTLHDDTPAITASEAKGLLSSVSTRVKVGTLTLHAADKTVQLKPTTYVTWFEPIREKNSVKVSVSSSAVTDYLKDILPQVSSVAKNAKFTFQDGLVKQIQGSANGRELDVAESVGDLTQAVEQGTTSVTLAMHDVTPEATADSVANLGIKELVAVGKTNFVGSPTNRRWNISVGSNLLNGLLIKPGEEFSLIKTIGPVDATLGYRQELVIKGDHTIPEFGGGLCQVGTTLFRAVMNAGLPVLERQNHSYRVSYYEPPVGMDATIYEPKPDFRFKNDYGTYLLLQTRIEGDNLIFEFWGTKDMRTSAESTPKVSNVVAPPAPLTVETTDIPVGTTKCIEHAHNGSDAEFTYSVTKDGKTTDVLFKSHYKPWRQVCLLGVKKLSTSPPTTTPKNSNANSNTNTPLTNSNSNKNTNSSSI